MKKYLIRILLTLTGLYIVLLVFLYFFQEKLLFRPEELPKQAVSFPVKVTEEVVAGADGTKLHGLLVHRPQSRGLIFYLHGNAGNAYTWIYDIMYNFPTDYDVFIFDYRGYGKSEGSNTSEAQVMDDVTAAFDFIVKKYGYTNVVVNGYSIGTGPATQLAAIRPVKALVLQAPYYSLSQLCDEILPILPDFIKRYRFETYKYITKVKAPVYLFHGTNDQLITFHHSEQLKKICPKCHLIPIEGALHNALNANPVFLDSLQKVLQ